MTDIPGTQPRGTVYGGASGLTPVPPRPPRRGVMRALGFFDSGRKIVVGIAGFFAAVVSLWATVVPLIWGKPSATPTPTPAAVVSSPADDPQIRAAQLRACEERHQMTQAQQRFTTSDYAFSFRFCQWPAPSFADGDGFSEITVSTVEGPGAYEALGTTLVDRIHGPCAVFRLAYDFGKMGDSEHLAPFLAHPEELLFGGKGDPYPGQKNELSFYPDRDEVDVLHNGSYQLFTASCDS
jgi:hypothetical protein